MIYIALLFVVCFYLHIATRGEQRLLACKKNHINGQVVFLYLF